MTDKVKVQELASEVLKLEYLCLEGEQDDRKLEKQLKFVADLARNMTCAQYDKSDDQGMF